MMSNFKWLRKTWILLRSNRWIRRILEGVIFFLIISLISFAVVKIAPGDITMSLLKIDTVAVTTDEIEALRQELGLDIPLYQEYFNYMGNLLRLDLGKSLMTGRSVTSELLKAFPATLALAGSALFLTTVFTFVFGILSARYANSWIDKCCTVLCLVGASLPTFWLGLLLLDLFAVRLKIVPSMGLNSWNGLILPAISLAIAMAPPYIKIFRNSLIEISHQEFIRAARSRGLQKKVIFFYHIFRGSLIPVVTILGVSFGSLLGGAVIVEIIFGIPGVGKLVVEAITRRDYAIIQGFILFLGIFIFAVNLLVDMSYCYLNPAISLKEAERK